MRIFILFLCAVAITLPTKARELDVVVGWNKPPYVISQEHSGFEIDLVRAILTEMGHTLSPIYVPFGRTARLLKDKAVDIGLTQNAAHNLDDSVLSDPYIIYQNVVVTKAQNNFDINEVNDLKSKRVIAFQTAQSVLGEEFKQALALEPMYMEMARQDRQVDMLMLDHVDAIVLDRNIFNHFRSQNSAYAEKETVFHELFPISAYCAAIPEPELREKFNAALHRFIADGRYQLLLDEYQLDNLLHKLPKELAAL